MASATLKSVPFVCVWTQKKPVDDIQPFLEACMQFFDAHKGSAAATYEHPRQVLAGECEDTLWHLKCELNLADPLESCQVESLSRDIACQWCTAGIDNSALSRFLLWLMPDRRLGFRQDFLTIQQDVKIHSISFGLFVGLNLFAERHTIIADPTCTAYRYCMDCTFKHDEKQLQVFLALDHCVVKRELYRINVDYDSIVRVVVHDPVDGPTDAYLHLSTLPLFYSAIDSANFFARFPEDQRPKTRDEIDFQRTLEVGCTCCSFLESRDIGGCWVLKLGFADSEDAHIAISRLSRKCPTATIVYAPVRTKLLQASVIKELKERLCSKLVPQLGFRCSYALTALLKNSDDALVQMGLMSSEVQDIAEKHLESLAKRNVGALEQAMFAVGRALDRRGVVTFTTALPLAFQKAVRETCFSRAIPHNSCLIRRIVVTPSHVFYRPPVVHGESRVLRKFDASCMLRASFRDDNFERLSETLRFHHNREEVLDQVVGRFLREGVWIGDRHFRLLAGSQAEIENHEMWLYANDSKGKTVESIRSWMGDLDSKPSLAGKMALMGQCLSTSQQATIVPLFKETTSDPATSIGLNKDKVLENVADIEGGTHPDSGEPFVFSEGIGMISPSLMREVCADLGTVQVPSAIEIFYAGFRGVVCVNDTLEDDKLVVRESMYKFDCSTLESIEVVRTSAPTLLFLNRPLITVLEQLGVPGRVFLRLQQRMVLELCDAFVDDLAALRVLCIHSSTSLPFSQLHMHGLPLSQEPFTRSLLLAVYNSLIAGLQEESRVAVPPNGGRSMMGVLDETGTLECGQVFVQYTQLGVSHNWVAWGGGEDNALVTEVLTGTVLVTKHACYHPGDARKFQAVDVPALRHIKDCIVFPSKGPRPHPVEIGGSGLGGDEYVVIWEKELLFPGDNREPREPRKTPRMVPSTGDLNEDIIQFLCWYILNDSTSIMSDAYLVFADAFQGGIFSHRCLSLAEKISTNLESAKTGVCAELARRERPKEYPDFLRAKYKLKPSYQSVKALGDLHRSNRPLSSHKAALAFKTEDFHYKLFEYTGWVKHVEMAREAMSVYAYNVSQILNQHSIESEVELITGAITSSSCYEDGRNDGRTLAVAQYQTLVELMQARFVANVDAAAPVQGGQTGRVSLEMASAWYMAAYTGTLKGEKNVLGFPWCIADNLLLLLREHRDGFPVSRLSSPRNLLAVKINNSHRTTGPVEDEAFDMLCTWAGQYSLLRDPSKRSPQICTSCFKSVFSEFVSSKRADKELNRRGAREDPCGAITVGEYVCDFLRQLATAPVRLPACVNCGSQERTPILPTLAALHRYARLVMSQDMSCFGLPRDPSVCDGVEELFESEPVRINVTDRAFLDLVMERPEFVRDLLCQWSGVKEVSIRWRSYRSSKYYYVVVSAVGRPWELCFFDKLVVEPWLQNAIVSRKPA
ncbi:uncharacterized protein LOC144162963 [Haemaphysalis longicornis]